MTNERERFDVKTFIESVKDFPLNELREKVQEKIYQISRQQSFLKIDIQSAMESPEYEKPSKGFLEWLRRIRIARSIKSLQIRELEHYLSTIKSEKSLGDYFIDVAKATLPEEQFISIIREAMKLHKNHA